MANQVHVADDVWQLLAAQIGESGQVSFILVVERQEIGTQAFGGASRPGEEGLLDVADVDIPSVQANLAKLVQNGGGRGVYGAAVERKVQQRLEAQAAWLDQLLQRHTKRSVHFVGTDDQPIVVGPDDDG